MKTAIITYKEYQTGNIINEGEAILLNRLDHQENRSFYEIRFLNNPDTSTHCRWINNNDIITDAE